ncbi:hypothetical protein Gbem_4095 [Citrifermentans bemidjiense Bem]|uniref:Uncharacterized protein n=1 Tax=Citrifermentans bemidjiense (strain ATCC BAA-1014 / DSM 16622 / JCM 12645 / Bem) TaxID=404380 RepID=E1P6A1_CITBB|nr:hypothetical protein Gbem_4095 [Citrifermentans bemidjiense Bem]
MRRMLNWRLRAYLVREGSIRRGKKCDGREGDLSFWLNPVQWMVRKAIKTYGTKGDCHGEALRGKEGVTQARLSRS